MSFKLKNADFPPLLFPSASKPISSISGSLPFITAGKPFPSNINIRSFAISTNTSISHVPRILQDNLFPKIIPNPSKSLICNLACNIPIKHNQWSVRKSVHWFQSVVVDVYVVSVPVCQRLYVVKPVFRHQHVSCLAKPIFLTVDTVTDILNVCNIVKYVSLAHNVRKIFPSIYYFISIPRQFYCLENNNIANSHLPSRNLLSSSETKSTSSLTSNLNFSECIFSLPEISCCQIYRYVSSSVKFSLFFMLFNGVTTPAITKCAHFKYFYRFYFVFISLFEILLKMCGIMTFYIEQHENLLRFLFDSFLTCNGLKITCSISMEDFSLNFKVSILITICLVFCLKNKTFLVMVQKFCPKGSCWINLCERLIKVS